MSRFLSGAVLGAAFVAAVNWHAATQYKAATGADLADLQEKLGVAERAETVAIWRLERMRAERASHCFAHDRATISVDVKTSLDEMYRDILPPARLTFRPAIPEHAAHPKEARAPAVSSWGPVRAKPTPRQRQPPTGKRT